MTGDSDDPVPTGDTAPVYVRRHLRFGWGMLLVFLTLGIALEVMHGLKLGWYLNVANETRRLMWRLAHAHGVLLALVNLAFASTVRLTPPGDPAWRRRASRCLRLAGVLLPGGFLLGGIIVYEADPWIGILLVPFGAFFLFVGVLLTVRGVSADGARSD